MSFAACPGDVSTLEQSHPFSVTSCLGLKSIGMDGQIFNGLERDKKSHMVLLPIDPALQVRLSFRTIALAIHFSSQSLLQGRGSSSPAHLPSAVSISKGRGDGSATSLQLQPSHP